MKTSALGAALLLATLLPAPAAAQSPGAVALDQLDPSPAGDPFFGVPSPFVGGHLVLRAQVLFSHADAPLTLAKNGVEQDLVGSQSFLYAGASVALWDRLVGSAVLPIAVAQTGEGVATPGGVSPGAPASPVVGDLRLGVRVRLLGEEQDPIQLAVGAALHLPTGATDAYVGEDSVRVAPQLVLGGRLEPRLVWSAMAGATFRGSGNPSTMAYGGGAALLLWDERLQVGPELYAATPIQGGSLSLTERVRVEHTRATRLEALLGVRVRPVGGLVLGAAIGPGIGEGFGTPSFRMLGTIAWVPLPHPEGEAAGAAEPSDVDQDGLLEAQDACPHAYGPRSAEPKRNGCPVEDRDEDGFPDPEDACPEMKGVAGASAARRGCPPDADGDGVQDALDFCPAEAGPVSGEGTRPGCPLLPTAPPVTDKDGDGILGADDACPGERGPASNDAAERGCPKWVRVHGDEVVLREPVVFRGQAALPSVEPRSVPVLEELAAVIREHPEWAKVEVQVHTDSSGDAEFNQTISEARAESARKWLVDHGIAGERLVAKGYGASKPIADNATAAGRKKNGRVQFLVLEKK